MLINVGLPLSLAIVMFSLGLGLTFGDFGRGLALPRAAFAMLLVPAAVYGITINIVTLPAIWPMRRIYAAG